MPATIRRYKAACVQAEPGWFNLQKSVDKTVALILEAGEKGCKLIAFPELWIPGYPYWQWRVTYQDSLPLLKDYCLNSLAPDSEEMQRIRKASKTAQVYTSLGYSELDGNSLYIAQVLIDPAGAVVNHRRKIKPTHVEKLVFGEGSGDSLDSVVETEIGRLGHLNCWENMNPFLKAHSCALNEEVHVAAWPVYPPASSLRYPDPYTNISEVQSEHVTPAYAYETGTWTLAPSQLVTRHGARLNLPKRLRDDESALHAEAAVVGNGFARIYRPDGSRAVEDPAKTFEGIFVVDIDLDENVLTKRLADFGGHYMRPDLIRLLVDKTPKTCIVDANSPDPKTFPSTLERLGLGRPLPGEAPSWGGPFLGRPLPQAGDQEQP
ncbi:Nitrilase/cyanide hydratase and apolipoprotein N-acyltransferase [Ophiocordyceps sinensis CO18]|uniref:Nitrilase/cyanide hydratase and apolipoprotein N-acyltransferase n=1 Tax=Ophiocordyceps sinensis (strain Co18 / CGMCC 3.14243) TaxID=911162 RepID=T5AJZ8_OPHSC|nr:Nitrilase/cyanide hydratase and apolipoprotein N-acyltransferase [Ophiocordyceps sinensis CO18]